MTDIIHKKIEEFESNFSELEHDIENEWGEGSTQMSYFLSIKYWLTRALEEVYQSGWNDKGHRVWEDHQQTLQNQTRNPLNLGQD